MFTSSSSPTPLIESIKVEVDPVDADGFSAPEAFFIKSEDPLVSVKVEEEEEPSALTFYGVESAASQWIIEPEPVKVEVESRRSSRGKKPQKSYRDSDPEETFEEPKIQKRKEPEVFNCVRCKFCSFSRLDLIVHQNRTHLDSDEFTCAHCFVLLDSNQLLQEHYKKIHRPRLAVKKPSPQKSPRKPRKVIQPAPSLFCDSCGYVTNVKSNLKKHIERCYGLLLTKFRCELCFKRFTTSKDLRSHKDTKSCERNNLKADPATNNFHCCHCPKQFKGQKLCKMHIEKVHP